MIKVRMTEKQMEDLAICKDCHHFHRYRLRSQSSFREEGTPEGQVDVYEDVNTYCRCLIGRGLPPLELTDSIIVDCNQFERREAKKKL